MPGPLYFAAVIGIVLSRFPDGHLQAISTGPYVDGTCQARVNEIQARDNASGISDWTICEQYDSQSSGIPVPHYQQDLTFKARSNGAMTKLSISGFQFSNQCSAWTNIRTAWQGGIVVDGGCEQTE